MASYKPNQGITQLKVLFRVNPLPIDSTEIWESLSDAQSYIAQANAYAGQTIKVKLEDGKYHQFILQSTQEGYELQELGVSPDQIKTLELELDTKSPLESPAFTGTVTIEGEKAATQDWVNAIIGQLNSGIPGIIDGTENPFPSTDYKAGQMWRVAAEGTYAGAECEIGDLIICLKDYVEGSAENTDFMVIQANIDGAVTGADASTDGHIVVFDGSTGKVIKDSNVSIASLNEAISKAHEHNNKTQLDTFTKTQEEILAEASTEAQSKVSTLSEAIDLKLNTKADSATVDAKIEAAKFEGLEAIETGIQELENGQVALNKNDIAALKSGKADKSTTLAGYGIADAYTKAQTDSAIATAVTNADHLKREIVEELPDPGEADENIIYMVGTGEGSEDSAYEEYMLINGSFEKIGSSTVDLTDYAKKSEVTTAKDEAITTAGTNADSKISAKVGDIGSSTVKQYVDQAEADAIASAKTYSDGLAKNYATATQGAKADTALQKSSISTGTENGTIAVDGTDVAVKGLGNAAYKNTSDFASTEDVEEMKTELAKKLDKNQGTENAGKVLVVGEDGSVIPGEVPNDLEAAIENYYALRRTGKVYQTKIWKFATNPSPEGEKLLDNAGLVFEPSTDTVLGQDDYLNGQNPLFEWVHVNYVRDSDGSPRPIAIEGDSNYKTTGAVDIGAMQMSFWWKWDASNPEYDLITISDTPHEELGLVPWCECVRADGTILPWCIGSAYLSVEASDGMPRSQHGKIIRNVSHNNMITNYQKKGEGYWGAGACRNTFQIIFALIKGATKSTQTLFSGVTNYSPQYEASIQSAEAHTYFPVTNAQAENIPVGCYVSVGYGGNNNGTANNDRGQTTIHAYADDVKVLRKEALEDGANTAIYLDIPEESAFNTQPHVYTETFSAPIMISSMHAWSGTTDAVRGRHDGSPVSNTDGKHPYRVQGREYAVGGYIVASDTVALLNADGTRTIYAAEKGVDHSSTDATIKSTYKIAGTIPVNSSGSVGDFWIGDDGFDTDTGTWYPAKQGSGSTQGVGDMYYAGGEADNTLREYLQGGNLGYGSNAGASFLDLGGGLGYEDWYHLGCD